MNKIGFGFLRLPFKDQELDFDSINLMVDEFMESGGTYFDTCYTYLNGKSEEAILKCVVERKPRNQFEIANKLPGYLCKSYDDCIKYFKEQCIRCGVDYFDVYMLHWLNAKNYEIACKYNEFEFLKQLKFEGKAKRIGFSYHDSASLLDEILTSHPEIDIVQLQINYLDYESASIQSRLCYEVCLKHHKEVIVMEPIKGGTLASIPDKAKEVLKTVHDDWTEAMWALRFVESLDNVSICLSGMNSLSQVQENMLDFEPMSEYEKEVLLSIVDIIIGETAIPCTGCRYCMDYCPKKIVIPDYFKMYNEIKRFPKEDWKIIPSYKVLSSSYSNPDDCINCKNCEKHCPQSLPITSLLKDVKERFQ